MSLRSGTIKYGDSLKDEFVNIDGYSRNLVLEQKLEDDVNKVLTEMRNTRDYEEKIIHGYAIPSWWERVQSVSEYGWHLTSHQEALDYLLLSQKYHQAKIKQFQYRCSNYPRDPVFCQHVTQFGGTLGKISSLIPIIQSRISVSTPFELLPQVFAEEDPSVNSGLNGNEQESQVINYPQSANVRITFTNSNIGMFSSSIPINDIGQLQILSNESNEWRYTLIGSSTNQPLMTLSGLINKINNQISVVPVTTPQPQPQPEPDPEPTTVHIPPPEIMPVQEQGESCEVYRSRLQSLGWYVDWISDCPTPTPTPTEPSQVNWIPEPFFSFINNVFRR